VDLVVAWARSNGIRHLLLDVADLNGPVVALYKAKGFVPMGRAARCHRRENTFESTSANSNLIDGGRRYESTRKTFACRAISFQSPSTLCQICV
jgi:hypothetical protein